MTEGESSSCVAVRAVDTVCIPAFALAAARIGSRRMVSVVRIAAVALVVLVAASAVGRRYTRQALKLQLVFFACVYERRRMQLHKIR